MKDKFGIPVLRFHWKWSDHELNQVRHMQQTFRAILEGMGGQIAAGGRGGRANQPADPPAQTGQRAGGQAPQTGQAGRRPARPTPRPASRRRWRSSAPAQSAASRSRAAARSSTRSARCAWATTRSTSPLNKYCQAHEVKNLFVADAAPFVSNADKNPTHTIVALAWRTAEYLAEELRKGNV